MKETLQRDIQKFVSFFYKSLIFMSCTTETTWIEVPTDKNVTAGSSFSYTISFATNSLDPAVVWYKNSFKLPKELYKETWRREGAKYTSTLVFSDLDTSHTGKYRTMVDLKELSPIEHHATLTVWCKFFKMFFCFWEIA